MKQFANLTVATVTGFVVLIVGCARSGAPSAAPSTEVSGTIDGRDTVDLRDVGDATDAGVVADSAVSTLGRIRAATGRVAAAIGLGGRSHRPPPYTGTDPRGIPNYARRTFSDVERRMLREAYGVENPSRLYVSDSTEDGLLKYDTRAKHCRSCYVNSYRIGFNSVRRADESWEQVERRVRSMRARDFSARARAGTSRLTADLDPDVRADVERMLADARRAGFALRVVATYRSPEHQAYLMAIGGGRTHTLTSLHSYGRAVDVVIGDGNLKRRATRDQWVAFRRWVTRYDGDHFRILGTPERTWDWRHIEIPTAKVGFRTIEAALARAAECGRDGRYDGCDFAPNLP